MGLSLLAPLGLLALTALAVPILLHLRRRLVLERHEFAALRWVGSEAAPRRRLRVERPWLLAARLALLAVLALLLAEPVLERPAPTVATRPSALVAPGLDRAAARAEHAAADFDWRWLAPGFPPLDEAPPATAPVASLLREADARLPPGMEPLLVLPSWVEGLDGERPALVHRFRTEVRETPPPPSAEVAPVKRALHVRHDPSQAGAVDRLRAVVAAWNVASPGCCTLESEPLDAPLPAAGGWLVWLGPPSPALERWIEAGGQALVGDRPDAPGEVLWRDADGRVLARDARIGAGRRIAFAGPFDPAALPLLADADFPRRLAVALDGPPPAPTLGPATALEPARATTASGATARNLPAGKARPLAPVLAFLAALLFLLERLLATARRGEAGR